MKYMQQVIPRLLGTEPITVSRERYARIAAGIERSPFINIPRDIVRILLATPPFNESVFSDAISHNSVPLIEHMRYQENYTDSLDYVPDTTAPFELALCPVPTRMDCIWGRFTCTRTNRPHISA